MANNTFRLPSRRDRVAVVGRTGSGKTQFATWLLSEAEFDTMPYVVIDFKGDDLIGGIERAEEISLNTVPKHPGIYVVRPIPGEEDLVEAWLWKVWSKQDIGLHIDEMYLMPKNSNALKAILTTGRSRHIPVTMLSQRPSHVPLHVFSEADFHSVFHLNFRDDVNRVREYFHSEIDLHERLPDFHSRWYDVGKNAAFGIMPAPGAALILERLHERLKPKRKFL